MDRFTDLFLKKKNELEVAEGKQSVISAQVTNGVAIRMALLYLFATRTTDFPA